MQLLQSAKSVHVHAGQAAPVAAIDRRVHELQGFRCALSLAHLLNEAFGSVSTSGSSFRQFPTRLHERRMLLASRRANRYPTMCRASPDPIQRYSGRRSSHGGYGGSKGEMGNIWEVVAALENALQDARNQLVSLMHTSKSNSLPTLSPGGQRCMNQCRAAIRNLHRAHAHGHDACGARSEYPVTSRRSRVSSQQAYSSPPAPAAGRRCTHPLHGIGAEDRNLLSARRVHPSGVAKGCRMSHPAPRVDRACVKDQAAGSNCHDSSWDPQRRKQHHCTAKQFATLLSHEAHQQRERRVHAEELVPRDRRPSWSRF